MKYDVFWQNIYEKQFLPDNKINKLNLLAKNEWSVVIKFFIERNEKKRINSLYSNFGMEPLLSGVRKGAQGYWHPQNIL